MHPAQKAQEKLKGYLQKIFSLHLFAKNLLGDRETHKQQRGDRQKERGREREREGTLLSLSISELINKQKISVANIYLSKRSKMFYKAKFTNLHMYK